MRVCVSCCVFAVGVSEDLETHARNDACHEVTAMACKVEKKVGRVDFFVSGRIVKRLERCVNSDGNEDVVAVFAVVGGDGGGDECRRGQSELKHAIEGRKRTVTFVVWRGDDVVERGEGGKRNSFKRGRNGGGGCCISR